jgi:hypothetical protein
MADIPEPEEVVKEQPEMVHHDNHNETDASAAIHPEKEEHQEHFNHTTAQPTNEAESFASKIANAPRRAKERMEEIGAKAEAAYYDKRVKPAEQAALNTYTQRIHENEQGRRHNESQFAAGEISKTEFMMKNKLFDSREEKYREEARNASTPIEGKALKTAREIGQEFVYGGKPGAEPTNAVHYLVKGAKKLQEQVRTESGTKEGYFGAGMFGRPSPASRFKPGRGVRTHGFSGGINFGGGMFGDSGNSPAFSFSTPLFGEQQKPSKKKRR